MAVRRTGMFDAPSSVVSVQTINSPVGDTAGVWQALSQTAGVIMDKLQPLRNQAAQNAALQDASEGRYGLRAPLSDEAEIYNNAMTQSYLLATERDIDQRLIEIESEHADSPEAFTSAFDGVRAGFMENAPDDLAPHLDALLTQRETEATRRIGERLRNRAIEAYASNAAARLAQMEARLTGYEDINSEEFQTAFSEYEQTGLAIMKNPLSGVTGDEWEFRRGNFFSRLTANQVANQAITMYQDEGGNAESAARAIAFVEEQMRNPELVLTEAQRDASFNEARRRINAMEVERRRSERELATQIRLARSEANNEARDLLSGANAMAQSFVVIPDDEIAELSQAVQASGSAARAREFNELVIENNVRGRLQGATLPQIDGVIGQFRELAQQGDGDAAVALLEAQRYRDNLLRADTVTGMQLHQGQAPAPLYEGLGPRIRQVESFGRDVGRNDLTYLSPGEREALAAEVSRGGEGALSIIRGIVSEAASEPGGGRLRAQRILSEIAGAAGPEYAAIGNVYLRGGEASSGTARVMTNAIQARQQEGYNRSTYLPTNRPAGVENTIIAEVLGEQNMRGMSPEELNEIQVAADLYYEGRAIGDPAIYESSSRYENAYRSAVQSVLGGVSRNIGGREFAFGGVADTGRRLNAGTRYGGVTVNNEVVIPNWIRRDQFSQVYRSLSLGDFSEAGNGRIPMGGAVSDWREARLVPTGRELGEYFLIDENGARYMVGTGADRQPYAFNINRLRASLAERRRDAVVP